MDRLTTSRHLRGISLGPFSSNQRRPHVKRYQKLAAAVLSLALITPAFADAPAAPPKAPVARPAPKPAAQKIAPADPRLTPPFDKLDLKDGDTVVFLGDSITHQCLYTQYLEDFFYTRYPNV